MLLTIGVIVAVLGGIAVVLIRAKQRADAMLAQWVAIPGYPNFMLTSDTTPNERMRIRGAVEQAVAALTSKTLWGDTVIGALWGVRIGVSPVEFWEAGGQKVAGQTFLNGHPTVLVGPSLAALCHEFGHVLEARTGRQVDYSHASWKANGMEAAQAEYALARRE